MSVETSHTTATTVMPTYDIKLGFKSMLLHLSWSLVQAV